MSGNNVRRDNKTKKLIVFFTENSKNNNRKHNIKEETI